MKKLLLSLLMAQIAMISFGQSYWDLNFDDTTYLSRVIIDTTHNPFNIWQVGEPNKSVFNNAYSDPNVIITDSIDFYPTNDTSSFIIIHIANDGWYLQYPKVDLGGWYYVNSDTLTDYGYFDFSPDKGNTWYRADSSLGHCSWGANEELPVFTGNSNGWKYFYYCFFPPVPVNLGDTVLYRFTFISDSIQTYKDGIMFDNLHFEDWSESIPEIQNDNLISIYPNPVKEKVFIDIDKRSSPNTLQIFNFEGKIMYEKNNLTDNYINVSELANGIYILKYSDNEYYSVKKFVISK